MEKIIKITESQLNELNDTSFSYWDENNDIKNYNGQLQISANGTKEPGETGEPLKTDTFSKSITPQGYARYRGYGLAYPRRIVSYNDPLDFDVEDKTEITEDETGVTTNTAINPKELEGGNAGPDGDEMNQRTKISNSIKRYMDILFQKLSQTKLRPRQYAMILNMVINELNQYMTNIPQNWKVAMRNKIMKGIAPSNDSLMQDNNKNN